MHLPSAGHRRTDMPSKFLTPLVVVAALFVAATGVVHLRQWLETYRDVPSSVEGAFVVTIGFPVHFVVALVAAGALLAAQRWRPEWLPMVAAATIVFELGAIAALLVSRYDSLFGWSEPTWTTGAERALALEIGSVVVLAAVLVLQLTGERDDTSPSPTPA